MTGETQPQRRPRARNARPKIERAALKLFVSKSVDAATTREIAEEAGVSEGALYRHYIGKDELALSLFMATHNRLGQMMVDGFRSGTSLEDRVERVVTAYCQLADEDWLLFSFHLLSMHKYLPNDIRREDDPQTITETLIQGLMESGVIPQGDPAVLASMCLGVMTQSGQNKAYNRLPGPMSAHIPVFTRAILAILMQK